MDKMSRPVDKENLIQAVVIADCYNDNFCPTSDSSPVCLMPIVNRPLLDYTLECLSAAGVQEVILFCSSFADRIKEFVKNGNWGHMTVNVVVSEGCRSFGDAMRDLDAKALIRTDFILLSGTVIGSLDLIPLLDKHKNIQKTDKGAAMTVLFKECGNKVLHAEDEIYVALDTTTDRLLFHNKQLQSFHIESSYNTKLDIPLEVVLERNSLDIRCNVMDTGVSICSISVPPLFSDNFDFQTREDFIRGLLMNEEILASTLYAHILSSSHYLAQVTHWNNYHSISRDIIHRWTYPQVPGGFIDDMYSFRFGNIYLQNAISMDAGSKLVEDVVIGQGCSIGAKTQISSSVLAKGCNISSDCLIRHSHLYNGVTVHAGCIIEYSILGPGCIVKSGVKMKSCILGSNVVVPSEKSLEKLRLQDTPLNKDEDGLGEKAYEYRRQETEDALSLDSSDSGEGGVGASDSEWIGLEPLQPTHWLLYEDIHSDDEQPLSHTSSIPDDTNLFFTEVMDSLSRGLEDGLPCDNLVLEVNSSRYAYNVSLREVNYHVSRAILSLAHVQPVNWPNLSSTVDYFMPLLNNYIKNADAMMDCLSAIEDVCESKEHIQLLCLKLLNYLYEKDILSEESILEWYRTPRDNTCFSLQLRKQVLPFVKWLQEADEQSDSD